MQNKADLNKENNYGRTALHYSVDLDKTALSKLLIENQSPINVQDVKGFTPLMLAIKRRNAEVSGILVEHPDIDLSLETTEGKTAEVLLREVNDKYLNAIILPLLEKHSSKTSEEC